MNARKVTKALHLNPALKIRDYYGGVMHDYLKTDRRRIEFLRRNFVEVADGDVVFVITLHQAKKQKPARGRVRRGHYRNIDGTNFRCDSRGVPVLAKMLRKYLLSWYPSRKAFNAEMERVRKALSGEK